MLQKSPLTYNSIEIKTHFWIGFSQFSQRLKMLQYLVVKCILSTGASSTLLQAVQVAIVDQKKCSDTFYPGLITDRMICAGTSGKSTCQVGFWSLERAICIWYSLCFCSFVCLFVCLFDYMVSLGPRRLNESQETLDNQANNSVIRL